MPGGFLFSPALQLPVLARQHLAVVLALRGQVTDGRVRASLPLRYFPHVARDEPSEFPRGKTVDYGIQDAVEPHEKQCDLVGVTERLASLQVPGNAAPALIDFQHCEGPWELDDVMG